MAKNLTVKRKTSETNIIVSLNMYGKGKYQIKTGISFLDHMLNLLAKHALLDLNIAAVGDLDVDIHHTNEDVGLALGEAFSVALKDRSGIKRFGEATVPMDEALVRVALDFSGRPYLKFNSDLVKAKDVKDYSLNYAEQFFRAFSVSTKMTVHIDVLEGRDTHHILEAIFKAFAKAVSRAIEKEPRVGIPSTKGKI